MSFDKLLDDLVDALEQENGYAVAECITPKAPRSDPGRLYSLVGATRDNSFLQHLHGALSSKRGQQLSQAEENAWIEIYKAYLAAVKAVIDAEEHSNQGDVANIGWVKAYEAWKEVIDGLIRGFTTNAFPAWQIPTLYTGGKYLRIFAVKADDYARISGDDSLMNDGFQEESSGAQRKSDYLEDAARQMTRIFTCCLNDRSPIEESRKWGVYYIANLMFRIHFKLNSTSLSKNIIRTISNINDLPPLAVFPKAHQVTFNYYIGVIYFLEEDYVKAETHLLEAWKQCHKTAQRNQELILTYLIPCHLITSSALPSPQLLARFPQLQKLFGPLCAAIKQGDLAGFDAALDMEEREFVMRRVYLTLERGRDRALRNLFGKVFVAGGWDPLKPGQAEDDRVRRSRIPLSEFTAAVRLSLHKRADDEFEQEEVECMISGLIYKVLQNLMKGYISREHGIVVLNKKGAFPGTGI